jgi:hypothetical protein
MKQRDYLGELETMTFDRIARVQAHLAFVLGEDASVVRELGDILDELRDIARLRGRDE